MLGAVSLLAGLTTGGADAAAPRPLLPNLVALPTAAVYVGGPASYATAGRGVVVGCQPSEVAGDTPAPRRCLRFETHAANAGTGPLELHNRADEAATTRRVVQRVYNSDGTYRDSTAGTYVFHAAHAHFHYDAFAVASLWRADSRWRRLDRAPVREGRKAGFCLQDVYAFRAAGEPAYRESTSCYPTTVTPDRGLAQVSGVSPGWVDVYDMSLPHQYIEVSGVPDGPYLLRIELDPDHRLRERTTKDNAVWQRIRLCGDHVELVARSAACPR